MIKNNRIKMKSSSITVDPQLMQNRWLSYIDLLGFSNIVLKNNWINVFADYREVIEKLTRRNNYEADMNKIWFSDTLLIYSPDNSIQSFNSIERTTRQFIFKLISTGIPVRGAMSYGEFYADKENNIFLGKAFIEAHSFGENQNWIGFILCPSTIKQMELIKLTTDPRRTYYANWKIPYNKSDTKLPETLPAYVIGKGGRINNENMCLEKLKRMKEKCTDEKSIQKYKNTIKFISENDTARRT